MRMSESEKETLKEFLDWYDPEARHRDIGLDGVVDAFERDYK